MIHFCKIVFLSLIVILGVETTTCKPNIKWKHGELIVSDDEFTISVLNYLMTPSLSNEDALNDSVFWEICIRSDGALSEILGDYIGKGLKVKPKIVERLIGNETFTEQFIFYWTDDISWRYFYNKPSTERSNITCEAIYSEALNDLKNHITDQEYQYLLALKPRILKSLNMRLEN